jgi:hypothetical protein
VRVAVCTIAARNYIALVRSLFTSVAEFEPACDRFAFIIDDLDGVETLTEGTVLRPAAVFEPASFDALARGYDITELATAVKPALLRHLLDQGYDRVLYLDPDITSLRAAESRHRSARVQRYRAHAARRTPPTPARSTDT